MKKIVSFNIEETTDVLLDAYVKDQKEKGKKEDRSNVVNNLIRKLPLKKKK